MKYKAARPFVDAATGIHYKAGDIVDDSTVNPKNDKPDRLLDLKEKGLIVDEDHPLEIGELNGVVERVHIPEGQTEADVERVKPAKPSPVVGSQTPVQKAADKAANDKVAANNKATADAKAKK